VLLVLLGGERVERRVWEPLETGALVCTTEGYAEAVRSGGEPPTLGVRREFIEPLEPVRG
jgi:hypothetical protein